MFRPMCARYLLSDPLINKLREEAWRDDELSPFLVKRCRRFCRNDFVESSFLLLERGHPVTDCDEHVAVIYKLGLVAHSMAVPGNDDGLIVCLRQDRIYRTDSAVDASPGCSAKMIRFG